MAFGLALKSVSLLLRMIQFGACAVVLGIFSYFLATLHDHNLYINRYVRAVEGVSGAGVLYTIIAMLLVCFLGGVAFFSFIGMLLDLAFTGAFIYVAWETRGGAHSCTGYVNTPLGSGETYGDALAENGIHLKTACRLEKATFAVSIIALVLFFLTIPVELLLMRAHKKDKAFGPSPNNGYTAGTPRRKFWQRRRRGAAARDAEFGDKPDVLPAHQTPADYRTSYATESTAVGHEPVYIKYGSEGAAMTGAGAGGAVPATDAAYTPYRTGGTF